MPKTKVIPCTQKEIESIIEASIDDDFFFMLFKVAKKTGRRLGEYYNVKVQDINFERKTMITLVLKRRKHIEREAILDDELIQIIKRYISREKLKLDDYLFRKVGYRQIQNRIASSAKSDATVWS